MRSAGYLELLGRRGFLLFFLSQAAGEAGYAVYSIAVLWIALQVSGSLEVAGVVLAVEFAIYALSFLAGPFIDRARNLRTILLVGYPVQAALATLLGLLALLGNLSVPVLLLLVVLLSASWDFAWTATNAILPRIVPNDELFRANGLLSAVSGGNQLAGYALGAAAILVVRPAVGMLLYGALNVVAALLAAFLTVPPSAPRGRPLLEEFRDGWAYLLGRAERLLLRLSAFSAVEAFFAVAPPLLILALSDRTFADPALSYGVLFTAFAAGGVAGSLVLGQLNARRRLAALLLGATVVEGLLIVAAVSVAPALWASVPIWFAIGGIDVVAYTTLTVYLQATTPPELLGKTLTNQYLFRGGARSAGALCVGALAAALLPFEVGAVVGVGLVATGLVTPVVLPQLRRLAF